MDNYNNSELDNDSNSEITPAANEQDINNTEQPSDEPLSNGYNRMASSNREAFTRGLDNNYNYKERIARNKSALDQARARNNQTTKRNDDGEEKDKNILDKASDKANVLKNKASLLGSQIDSARSKAFQIAHPVEAAKIVAKKKIKAWLLGIIAGSIPIIFGIFVVLIATLQVSGVFDSDNNYSNGSSVQECGFTKSLTSLTKQEYKNKISDYANNSNSKFQIFADNAYDIYDYAKSKYVNPELVVVRAQAEGQGNTSGTYNYWGMGCTNTGGLKACFNYNSFEEAYSDFINLISTYESLADMMSSYSYIGDYWYTMDTPNPSGDGGCYYSKYIYPTNMPLRVQNACASNAPSCTRDGSKEKCTATTDEDQQAYMNWQVKQNMADIRYDIFGLEFEDGPCTNVNVGDNIVNSSGPNWDSPAWTVQVNPYSEAGLYGQCTWFAWGRFYEIYGYSPGFLGNGVDCAGQLLATHPDKFEKSTTPKAGAIFSCSNTQPWGHTGIVMEFDGTNITIQEANLDGVTNTFEDAKKDWREVKMPLSQWNNRCDNPIYANPK